MGREGGGDTLAQCHTSMHVQWCAPYTFGTGATRALQPAAALLVPSICFPLAPPNERCCPFRFRYNGFALARASAHSIERLRLQERRDRGGPGAELALAPGSEWLHREEADAVSTIMQWLHSRMEE